MYIGIDLGTSGVKGHSAQRAGRGRGFAHRKAQRVASAPFMGLNKILSTGGWRRTAR